MGHLDFLTMTFPYNSFGEQDLPASNAFEIKRRTFAIRRYEFGFILANGGMMFLPEKANARQKVLVQLSGQALASTRDIFQFTDESLLELVLAHEANITRLDYALDTNNKNITVGSVNRAIEQGKAKTRSTVKRLLEKDEKIDDKWTPAKSLYLGGDGSEQKLVVYDKAKDLGLLSHLIRFEFRTYGTYAYNFAVNSMENHSVDAVGKKKLSDYLRWNNPGYKRLLDGKGEVANVGRKSKDKFSEWLEGQVMPAIQKRSVENPDKIDEYMSILSEALLKIGELKDRHDSGYEISEGGENEEN